MSRSDRLFRLLQALRSLPAPVTAAQLASETGVSVRSTYRDIDSLRASGAEIGGERGYGYTLIEDGTLPPQTFTRMEIEALMLGLAEVKHMGDPALTAAANAVLGKVAATLPSLSQQHLLHAVSQVHHFYERYPPLPDMAMIRTACWREEALEIGYKDREGAVTSRTIWPLAIVYLDRLLVVLARCCLREDFRMFRADRITAVALAGSSFRPKRVALLREYQAGLDAKRAEQAA
ncbi:HTH domain-containing protein [Pseudoduganella lurida]|uniref:HTH domain-containing protein n=1 Tax=Pseudoduganella lurida TaxID=1036180 RepID=A0A562R8L2_9BURK|nr:YafY family protein [Pseudoduganella lurida]TWI65418.1 HTH domain-containing protein [Pseudoduganella lurida]